jgi:hypothetical protein
MDERSDLVRSVRDNQYRYVRNYMPHKIYGQYLEYLWKAPSMKSWETAYRNGELNEVQSAFWKPKPVEELYDVHADPHNIRNLAGEAQYKDVLMRMREANRNWMLEFRDVGFLPEPMMFEISRTQPLFDYARSGMYPLERIIETAEMASSKDRAFLSDLKRSLTDKNPVVRYWAAIGCTVLSEESSSCKNELINLLNDSEVSVRIAAAEALYLLSEKQLAASALRDALKSPNPMARVQALNVLENMGDDARPALAETKQLLKEDIKDSDYDVRAAKRILDNF